MSELFVLRLEEYVQWNSQRLFLMSIFIPNQGSGLEGILIKFSDARKLGEMASVSEYRIEVQKCLQSLTLKCKNSCVNKDKRISLGESPLLIL